MAAIVALVLLALAAGIAALPVLAAGAFGLTAWIALADRFMRPLDGVPCLTWHSVSEDARWLPWARDISVRPETLDRQLDILSRSGATVMDMVEFLRTRREGRPLPPRPVLLHFDDGYRDNWLAAAPILARHGMRATMFVSLDFIAPPATGRNGVPGVDGPAGWDGYLTWDEIRALDKGAFSGAFDIQPHGVDHARVPIGPRAVDRLTEANWRRLAWVQWRAMPGPKHDWYAHDAPPAVPLGSEVPESDGALAARAWTGSGIETEDEYAARVRADLERCRAAFRRELGKTPEIFCWPENLTSPKAREIAAELGFLATTGGRGANRPGEPAQVISRVHVGERAGGFDWPWLDDLAFRATVESFRGNHYWSLVVAGVGLIRRLHGPIAPGESAAGPRDAGGVPASRPEAAR